MNLDEKQKKDKMNLETKRCKMTKNTLYIDTNRAI